MRNVLRWTVFLSSLLVQTNLWAAGGGKEKEQGLSVTLRVDVQAFSRHFLHDPKIARTVGFQYKGQSFGYKTSIQIVDNHTGEILKVVKPAKQEKVFEKRRSHAGRRASHSERKGPPVEEQDKEAEETDRIEKENPKVENGRPLTLQVQESYFGLKKRLLWTTEFTEAQTKLSKEDSRHFLEFNKTPVSIASATESTLKALLPDLLQANGPEIYGTIKQHNPKMPRKTLTTLALFLEDRVLAREEIRNVSLKKTRPTTLSWIKRKDESELLDVDLAPLTFTIKIDEALLEVFRLDVAESHRATARSSLARSGNPASSPDKTVGAPSSSSAAKTSAAGKDPR